MEKDDDDDEKVGKKNAFGIIATVGNAFANYVRGKWLIAIIMSLLFLVF